MRAGKRGHGRALRRLALATLAVGACGALGCAGLGGKRWGEHPVTVTEVVVLSQHGVAPEAIVAKMRRGGTLYHLSDAQYAALRQKGVTPAVAGREEFLATLCPEL